jgi:spermidine/putrescine transport system substrate-binding protein
VEIMAKLTRRTLIKAGAIATVGAPYILGSSRSYAAGEVNLLTYNKHFPPQFIEQFQKDTGIRVNVRITDEQDKVFNLFSVERPNFSNDIVVAAGTRLVQFSSNQFIEPIDVSRLSGWKNLSPTFSDSKLLKIGGQTWGVPTLVLGQILAANPNYVPDTDTWQTLFDRKYTKRIVWKVADALQTAVRLQGKSADLIEFINDEAGAQAVMNKARDFLIEHKPYVLKFYEADAEVQQVMVNEDAYVANMTSGPAARLMMGGYPIKMFLPKEGSSFSVYSATIAKNAKNRDNAYKFLDAFLNNPAIGGFIAKDAGFISTFKDAGKDLSPVERAAVTVDESMTDRIKWSDPSNQEMVSRLYAKATSEVNAA